MKNTVMNFCLALALALSFGAYAQDSSTQEFYEPGQAATPALAASERVESEGAFNINTASAEQISVSLHGVGAAKAAAIVEFRQLNGPFKSLEELEQVRGLGAKTVAKNESVIRFE